MLVPFQTSLLKRDLYFMVYRQSALSKNKSQVLLQCNRYQYNHVMFYLDMTSASSLYSHLPVSSR